MMWTFALNGRFTLVCYLFILDMHIHATVCKNTDGRTATWRFVEIDGTFCAIGDNRKIIPCDNIDHMRNVYRRFMSSAYGFTPVIA
jgi:hypothetical protein